MKNISENSRGRFEKAWQDAFDGKELSPSPELWKNLDRHLANQETKKYRKGIFIYKWVAAAAVVIALGVSAVYFYNTYTTDTPQMSEVQPVDQPINEQTAENSRQNKAPGITQESALTDNATNTEEASSLKSAGKAKAGADKQNAKATQRTLGKEIASDHKGGQDGRDQGDQRGLAGNGEQGLYAVSTPLDNEKTDQPANVYPTAIGGNEAHGQNQNAINQLTAKGAYFDQLEPSVGDVAMQKVINYEDDPFKKKRDEAYEESLWAGINVSSGYFDPNFASDRGGAVEANSLPFGFFSDSELSQDNVAQSNSGGQSFSFGFNMGKRITKKWVLQSGINYLNYSAGGSTNAFYELSDQTRTPAISAANLEGAKSLNLASSLINFDNQFEFLSIPVKAGYILLDKKVSVLISAGVGTDFFLRNSISPDGNGLDDFDIKPGNDSPYRSVYFNGLMGTQLRYRFSKHYSFTFEPSYSVAINSFSKSDNDLESFPNVFRLGIGLKYHFK
ncbi:hypothetical protein QQ020_18535 [Fulvivirgaceae bacterium BMA12]|uniref:Outer membrane protein beta-barrel domain-containing protein n=1 Tax=Agaribacillus aureus TaxID=3051825 RepID=A0ABT8L8J7_9BACT|nr:hypothetical protein [Fulvivirgaceae bacterium BMA12]